MPLTKADSQVVTITATDVGLGNVTNESKATMFTSPVFTGSVNLPVVTEVVTPLTGSTGVVTHDTSTASVFYHTSIAANFTANFTNVPTTNNRVLTYAVVLIQGSTAYIPSAVQIDGTGQTINWSGNSTPVGTASRTDVVIFQLFRVSSTWRVIGSLGSY